MTSSPSDPGAAALFDVAAPAPAARLTADQRRVLRQAAAVAAGGHPLALVRPGVRVHPDAGGRTATKANAAVRTIRCGSCVFRLDSGYPKCLWRPGAANAEDSLKVRTAPPRYSKGPATDVRAWWPGCTEWRARP